MFGVEVFVLLSMKECNMSLVEGDVHSQRESLGMVENCLKCGFERFLEMSPYHAR